MKRLALGLLIGILGAGSVEAQTCSTSSWPYPLANNTLADATQVMTDLSCAPIYGLSHWTGNVGINITVPAATLDVAGWGRFVSPNAGTTGAIIIRDASGNPDAAVVQFVSNDNTAQYGFIKGAKAGGVVLGGGNAAVGTNPSTTYTFYVNGTAAATSWTSLSDARLKKNISSLAGALNIVESLQAVRYQWRDPSERSIAQTMSLPAGQTQIGLIAQNVAPVVPEAVNVDSNGVYGINYSSLVPVLIQAVKEQQAEIQQLQAQVAALKGGN
jgi:hypothetical protein